MSTDADLYQFCNDLRQAMTAAVAHVCYPHLHLYRRPRRAPPMYADGRFAVAVAFSRNEVESALEDGVPLLYMPTAFCPHGGMFDETAR